jgi:hypothetical protein
MGGGPLAAARLWAATDIRSRWKALLAVGVIAGLTAGLALASVAGARRTDTALDRLRERTNASDAIVFASQRETYHPDWTVLGRRPEVRTMAPWGLVFGNLDGDPSALFFVPVDDTWMQDVDKPLIVHGRMFDPEADDELMVAEAFAAAEGIHVGDTIPFTPYTVDEEEGAPPPLKGPALTMRIVGIMRTPIEELFVQDGFVVASPGIINDHPEVNYFENAFVQLVDPESGAAALEAHAAADITAGVPVLDLHTVARRVTATTDVQRSALLLLAAAIALAGVVLAGQVVNRSAALIGRDAPSLEAMGMRRSSVAAAALLSHLPSVVVAAVTCVLTATVTSRWLPFGLARRLEPDRGVHLDALVLVPGVLFLVAAVVLGVFASARAAARPDQAVARGTVGLIDWVRRHASVPVGIGTTMAFRRGGGRRAVPVRPALLGAIVGVLGVASAITLDAGLSDALDHPERAGVTWDGQITPGTPDSFTEHGFAPPFVSDVQSVPGVTDLVQVDRLSVPVQTIGTPGFALRPVDDETSISLVTLEGRGPERAGEVALGPDTLRTLGLGVGDEIEVGDPAQPMTVVGVALFPTEVHAGFDQGVWLSPDDYDVLATAAGAESVERWVAVRFADETLEEGLAGLQATAERYEGFSGPADVPPELLNLQDVQVLPRLLAAFLAVLALAALLHVLVTTARVRAHEFAVLRALGITRWGTRVVINVQGTAVFVIGLVLGAPIGIAAGRVGWRLIAERVPLEEASPMAFVALAALLPAVLVVAQVVAYGPGRLVGRLRAAEVLRTE